MQTVWVHKVCINLIAAILTRYTVFKCRIFESIVLCILQVGIPSMNNHPSCAFSKLDFDGDDEFNQFFHSMYLLISSLQILRKVAK